MGVIASSAPPGRTVYVSNGPNLNLPGTWQPGIDGCGTLADLDIWYREVGAELGLAIRLHQSNCENASINWVHEARHGTHTSVAIVGASQTLEGPVFKLHIFAHRYHVFRHHSSSRSPPAA